MCKKCDAIAEAVEVIAKAAGVPMGQPLQGHNASNLIDAVDMTVSVMASFFLAFPNDENTMRSIDNLSSLLKTNVREKLTVPPHRH